MKNSVYIILIFISISGCFNKKTIQTITGKDISKVMIIDRSIEAYKKKPMSIDTVIIYDTSDIQEIANGLRLLQPINNVNLKTSTGLYDIILFAPKEEGINMIFTTFEGVVFYHRFSYYRNDKLAVRLMNYVNKKYKSK
jgi:hypothetical protein